ncbi:Signal transduction histidine kinase [Butyrivibrio hungatei]|uniref:histidine kinase n=1 Tax=Butyrivibrio hungatei TaxID=185008 RepID=A0A1G5GJ46_9FIRM|nr:HAMP domain-containing sensor histidine kinase [Butyrivibrio hungatei]SCY51250.1 Signal transduction histidine kinase [Butyrivibrio hungatei]
MDNIILIIGIFLILAACIIAVTERLRSKRILDSIEKMLHMAMNGEFPAETFDEGRLSKLESELAAFLSSSSISAKNIENERDKIKSLISDISHQTKTPISNLILYSELLENSELSGVDRTNAEAIHAQAEKLRFLIDSLVKLSRLENGILALEPQETPLAPMLNEILHQFKEKAAAKNLKLELSETSASAAIDGKWTHEALANIVDNAIKYTDNGSIKISVTPYEMFVRVDIKDTGIGISEEEHPKIFKRFYRGTEVKQKEGVGIGLHLAREIISGEGGYIKLSSTPGEGSTFSVFLPR